MPKPQQLPKEHFTGQFACLHESWMEFSLKIKVAKRKTVTLPFHPVPVPIKYLQAQVNQEDLFMFLLATQQMGKPSIPSSTPWRSGSREPARHCKVHAASGRGDTSVTLLKTRFFSNHGSLLEAFA